MVLQVREEDLVVGEVITEFLGWVRRSVGGGGIRSSPAFSLFVKLSESVSIAIVAVVLVVLRLLFCLNEEWKIKAYRAIRSCARLAV